MAYAKAPITEAVIDIRLLIPQNFELTQLMHTHDGEDATYSVIEPLQSITGTFGFGPQGQVASTNTHPLGYRFKNPENTYAYQARADGFTFSRLKPYETWELFRDEAKRLWDKYQSVTNPQQIQRLALRYINQLDIPLPIKDFKDYFRTFPEVSPDLPQGLAGFL